MLCVSAIVFSKHASKHQASAVCVSVCVCVLQVTLQYCLWDQWKTVTTTEPRRLLCLAGLVGQLLSACVLPLSSLKPVSTTHAEPYCYCYCYMVQDPAPLHAVTFLDLEGRRCVDCLLA